MKLSVKNINPRLIYLIFFILFLLAGFFIYFDLYKKYTLSYELSREINTHLEQYTSVKIENTKAEQVIKFLNSTSTLMIDPNGLRNPFTVPVLSSDSDNQAE